MPTPYDNRIILWQWKGDSLSENTIDDLAQTIKRWAPVVSAVVVKTSDGSDWQGVYDQSPTMAINGPDSVDHWVQTLAKYSIDFHAWCVPKGVDITAESQKIIQVCTRPGVRSMILDVEPYRGFYQGGRETVRPLMTAVRSAIPGSFHIGLSVDPRPQHHDSVFPDEWFPFVQSVHPQVYWATFQQSPEDALASAYNTWSRFGRPIFPVLQADTDRASMDRARSLSVQRYGAKGITWWRLGAIGPAQWPAINVGVDGVSPEPPEDTGKGHFGRAVIVRPGTAGYTDGTYDNTPANALLQTFSNTPGWTTKFKGTSTSSSAVWARWDPQLTEAGWYEVSVYVPNRHATTANARFKIHKVRGRQGELELSVNQDRYFDLWVSLGVYYFEATDPTAAVVFLNDLTGESQKEIAFDAVRWRPVVDYVPAAPYLSDGFDAPIGPAEERHSDQTWPGQWIDATGYAVRYRIGTPQEAYHTGADLNLNAPYYDADAHSPVYSAANGVVTYAGRVAGWGRIIVIRHDPLIFNGKVVYARYAHVESPRVQAGQRVVRGEQIASVGNAEGAYPYHLHFDISPTTILNSQPWHWPKLNLNSLLTHYVDPRAFIAKYRPKS
jgi:murein DD-endopeptidase MepM/ murein hydrolase activator NlpD